MPIFIIINLRLPSLSLTITEVLLCTGVGLPWPDDGRKKLEIQGQLQMICALESQDVPTYDSQEENQGENTGELGFPVLTFPSKRT